MIRAFGLLSTLLLIAMVLGIGADLAWRGGAGVSWAYLTSPAEDLGRAGGIGPVLATTALIVLGGLLLSVLVSLPAAILMAEVELPRRLRQLMVSTIDVGVGVPRIVWGLFGGYLFCGVLGLGFSVISGILTLACLLAPIMVTGFVSGFTAVDPALRKAAMAVGLSRRVAFWSLVMPAARPALSAAVALGAGRACGDAAALIFTAGVVAQLPGSLLDPGATLSVFIYQLLSTVPGGQGAALTAAMVLFCISAVIQIAISYINHDRPRKETDHDTPVL